LKFSFILAKIFLTATIRGFLKLAVKFVLTTSFFYFLNGFAAFPIASLLLSLRAPASPNTAQLASSFIISSAHNLRSDNSITRGSFLVEYNSIAFLVLLILAKYF